MRAVIQRVSAASVTVSGPAEGRGLAKGGKIVGQIGKGLLVYLSVGKEDTDSDDEFMAEKLAGLRIFADNEGKMNRSVQDICGEVLIVSNFTLHGDCRKGRRPGFDAACDPVLAQRLYDKTAQLLAEKGLKVEKGVFGAYMQVESVNDGPVTFLLDSRRLF
jgi:D-tyrosyl-tRNA(Tyr) deacylase